MLPSNLAKVSSKESHAERLLKYHAKELIEAIEKHNLRYTMLLVKKIDIEKLKKLNEGRDFYLNKSYPILFYLIDKDFIQGLRFLLKKYPELIDVSIDNVNLLHRACYKGNLEIFNLLLEIKFQLIDSTDNMGCSPLHWAARYQPIKLIRNDKTEILKTLLSLRPHFLNLKTNTCATALSESYAVRDDNNFKFFLSIGASLNDFDPEVAKVKKLENIIILVERIAVIKSNYFIKNLLIDNLTMHQINNDPPFNQLEVTDQQLQELKKINRECYSDLFCIIATGINTIVIALNGQKSLRLDSPCELKGRIQCIIDNSLLGKASQPEILNLINMGDLEKVVGHQEFELRNMIHVSKIIDDIAGAKPLNTPLSTELLNYIKANELFFLKRFEYLCMIHTAENTISFQSIKENLIFYQNFIPENLNIQIFNKVTNLELDLKKIKTVSQMLLSNAYKIQPEYYTTVKFISFCNQQNLLKLLGNKVGDITLNDVNKISENAKNYCSTHFSPLLGWSKTAFKLTIKNPTQCLGSKILNYIAAFIPNISSLIKTHLPEKSISF